MAEVRIRISTQNAKEAERAVREVNKALKRLGIEAQISSDKGKRFAAGLQQSVRSLKTFALGAAAAVGAMTAAVAGATLALTKLATRGGEVINVQKAFSRAAGDVRTSLTELRRATFGLISNYDLMVGFNRAVTLGSAETIKQFGELARTAIALGRALGVDAAFALESLSLGIGRQSRLILDNLGLIVSVEQANEAYARSLNKTSKELDDAEKREAFRTAAMDAAKRKLEELGATELNTADIITRTRIAVRNLTDSISKLTATSPAVRDFFKSIGDIAESVATAASGNADQIAKAFNLLGQLAAQSFSVAFLTGLEGAFKPFTAIAPGFIERLALPLQVIRENKDRAIEGIQATTIELKALGREAEATARFIEAQRRVVARFGEAGALQIPAGVLPGGFGVDLTSLVQTSTTQGLQEGIDEFLADLDPVKIPVGLDPEATKLLMADYERLIGQFKDMPVTIKPSFVQLQIRDIFGGDIPDFGLDSVAREAVRVGTQIGASFDELGALTEGLQSRITRSMQAAGSELSFQLADRGVRAIDLLSNALGLASDKLATELGDRGVEAIRSLANALAQGQIGFAELGAEMDGLTVPDAPIRTAEALRAAKAELEEFGAGLLTSEEALARFGLTSEQALQVLAVLGDSLSFAATQMELQLGVRGVQAAEALSEAFIKGRISLAQLNAEIAAMPIPEAPLLTAEAVRALAAEIEILGLQLLTQTEMMERWGLTAEQAKQIFEALTGSFRDFNTAFSAEAQLLASINNALKAALIDTFIALGQSLSEIFTGILVGTENFGQSFARIIGALLTTLGRALVAFGIAGSAIKNFITNPIAAIAAGIALIALGSALASQATASVASAGSALASGGGYAPRSITPPSGAGLEVLRPITVQIIARDLDREGGMKILDEINAAGRLDRPIRVDSQLINVGSNRG